MPSRCSVGHRTHIRPVPGQILDNPDNPYINQMPSRQDNPYISQTPGRKISQTWLATRQAHYRYPPGHSTACKNQPALGRILSIRIKVQSIFKCDCDCPALTMSVHVHVLSPFTSEEALTYSLCVPLSMLLLLF